MLLASKNGRLGVVQALLAAPNVEVNKARTTDGATPLLFASANGYAEIVNALLINHADLNKATNTGWTPLLGAAYGGHLAVVRALLAAPTIEVNNAHSTDGATPLFLASKYGHADVVKELSAQSAEVDKTDNNGCTPLLVASQNGHLEAVQALLQAGANPDISPNGDYQFGYRVTLSNGKIDILVTQDASSRLLSSLKPIDCASQIHTQIETLLAGVGEADPHLQAYKTKLNDFTQIIRLLSQHVSEMKARKADMADLKLHFPKWDASPSYSTWSAAAAALASIASHSSQHNGSQPILQSLENQHQEERDWKQSDGKRPKRDDEQ